MKLNMPQNAFSSKLLKSHPIEYYIDSHTRTNTFDVIIPARWMKNNNEKWSERTTTAKNNYIIQYIGIEWNVLANKPI